MSTKLKKDFSHLGASFQKELAHLILLDRPFADQMEEVLEVNFLEFEYLQIFINEIFKYRTEYKVHPSLEIMESLLGDASYGSDADQKITMEFYEELRGKTKVNNADYVKERALEFCRKRKMYGALKQSIELMERRSYPEIKHIIEEALRLGSDKNVGHDFIKDFEERYVASHRFAVSTGFDVFDDIMEGGHGAGELGVVIAPTGAGKSQMLVNIGAAALKAGKNVVHYTMELSDKVVSKRYDSCLTGFEINELDTYKQEVFDMISDIEGKLITKYYPMNKAKMQTFHNHLERLNTLGFQPDIIIVDYADLIKPDKTYEQKRFDYESIYQNLRALAQEFEVPIWTATQTNRGGLNAELVTMEEIAEAFNKCYVSDFICTLSRTIADKETNTGRVFVAKNRNGIDGVIFPAYINWAKAKIKILEATGETIDEITQGAAKKQEQNINAKIAEFRDKYKKEKE